MSLIKCPGCGKEISGKAKKCIHCGVSLSKEEESICSECGKKMKDDKCSNCGYQNNKKEETIVNNNKNDNNNSKNTVVGGIVGTIVMIIIVYIMINIFSNVSSTTSTPKGPDAYKNTTWKTTDGYVLELKTDSCQVKNNGKVQTNKCEFTTNANGSGAGKITICDDEYGLNCKSFEISKENYLYDEIYLYGYIWYRQ